MTVDHGIAVLNENRKICGIRLQRDVTRHGSGGVEAPGVKEKLQILQLRLFARWLIG